MKRVSFVMILCAVALAAVAVFSGETRTVEAVTCSPIELIPCLPAISTPPKPPSAACCRKVKEQLPCFCGYLKDPGAKPFIDNPNIPKVASSCGVAHAFPPKC
ncbi:hypothetical protein E1A91_D02G240600v1 [Gossypium mustelinum]|uniref:Bifunctional inhibitor/plant lipid transfer protein/seed storage helical domain-containing protein n=3 Tax=Gossypium TaxID=3633 RepID=A0A5D2VZF5_GOSMU|nr:hypothetical protein ES288_D02G252300v1 [Gossypium darwinii]TYH85288.1 hypothetical protein ES332_D02G255700v1 [Gossypium tomentosum]TYI94924.1 hypothetical protein E1A91_D02G240600v1 [Gossypium mustelinum]